MVPPVGSTSIGGPIRVPQMVDRCLEDTSQQTIRSNSLVLCSPDCFLQLLTITKRCSMVQVALQREQSCRSRRFHEGSRPDTSAYPQWRNSPYFDVRRFIWINVGGQGARSKGSPSVLQRTLRMSNPLVCPAR